MVIRETAREVVEALGGIAAVAQMTGADAKTVSWWQSQVLHFPPKTYVVMTQALAARGLSAPDSLWKMVAREPAS